MDIADHSCFHATKMDDETSIEADSKHLWSPISCTQTLPMNSCHQDIKLPYFHHFTKVDGWGETVKQISNKLELCAQVKPDFEMNVWSLKIVSLLFYFICKQPANFYFWWSLLWFPKNNNVKWNFTIIKTKKKKEKKNLLGFSEGSICRFSGYLWTLSRKLLYMYK